MSWSGMCALLFSLASTCEYTFILSKFESWFSAFCLVGIGACMLVVYLGFIEDKLLELSCSD